VPTALNESVLQRYEPGPGVRARGLLSSLWKSIFLCIEHDRLLNELYLGYYCGPGERARTLSSGLSSATRFTTNFYPLPSLALVSKRVGSFVFANACGISFLLLHKLGLAPIPKDGFLFFWKMRLNDENAVVDNVYSV